MAVTVPTVVLITDVPAALTAICAYIDADRARLDAAETGALAISSGVTALQTADVTAASRHEELRNLVNQLRRKLR